MVGVEGLGKGGGGESSMDEAERGRIEIRDVLSCVVCAKMKPRRVICQARFDTMVFQCVILWYGFPATVYGAME